MRLDCTSQKHKTQTHVFSIRRAAIDSSLRSKDKRCNSVFVALFILASKLSWRFQLSGNKSIILYICTQNNSFVLRLCLSENEPPKSYFVGRVEVAQLSFAHGGSSFALVPLSRSCWAERAPYSCDQSPVIVMNSKLPIPSANHIRKLQILIHDWPHHPRAWQIAPSPSQAQACKRVFKRFAVLILVQQKNEYIPLTSPFFSRTLPGFLYILPRWRGGPWQV